ncbi:MAG: ATP phosphoribosyltransferase [Alphaproteobacteria bacterium]|nr:ATP phosphoribosyltransferase [Alphaproteobacteria bacterium]
MTPVDPAVPVRLALPKGRMADGVLQLLADAGVGIRTSSRGYRPTVSLAGFETKILKPQNIVEMLHRGSRDVGFAGHDWVVEKQADLVEVLDLGLDPVRIVAAAPVGLLHDDRLPDDPSASVASGGTSWVIASEYERLTTDWIARLGIPATFVRSYGATEVFPPEDADCIVDNTATGSTLAANGLRIFDTLLRSSTRLYAHPGAMDDPARRARIEHLALLLRAVLEARSRVMVEVNCGRDDLERILAVIPCMREPTVSSLSHDAGYAVKSAVPRDQLAELIPVLKAHGGTDIVVSTLSQIVP